MFKYLYLSFSLPLFVVCSCANNSTNANAGGIDGFSVNLNEDFTKDFSLFDLCSKVEIVELDKSVEGLLAEQTILSKAFGDTSFYVIDRNDYLIREYDYCGHLLTISDKHGRGPGEIVMAKDMIINKFTNTLDVLNPMGIIYKYSLSDLSLFGVVDFSQKVRAVHYMAASSKDDYYLFSFSESPVLIKASTDKSTTIQALDISIPTWLTGSSFWGGNTPFYLFDDVIKFTLKYDGTTYSIRNGVLSIDFQWNMGKHRFSPEMVEPDKDFYYYSDLLARTSHKYATTFNRAAESHRFLQNFRFKSPGSWNTIVLDKSTEEIHLFKKTTEGVYIIVGVVLNNCMYSIVDPDNCDSFVNERVLMDESSINTLNELSSDSNVVLIKYTLK